MVNLCSLRCRRCLRRRCARPSGRLFLNPISPLVQQLPSVHLVEPFLSRLPLDRELLPRGLVHPCRVLPCLAVGAKPCAYKSVRAQQDFSFGLDEPDVVRRLTPPVPANILLALILLSCVLSLALLTRLLTLCTYNSTTASQCQQLFCIFLKFLLTKLASWFII